MTEEQKRLLLDLLESLRWFYVDDWSFETKDKCDELIKSLRGSDD